jgi:hypothetical protein
MRPLSVWFIALVLACSSPSVEPSSSPDPAPADELVSRCYALQLGGTPSPDVALPAVIELSREHAPNFVTPGRLAVREPGTVEPRAPISWWIPRGSDAIELVLGGGYTGYRFSLRSDGGSDWVGEGIYFADFGLEPPPGPLPLRLTPSRCA